MAKQISEDPFLWCHQHQVTEKVSGAAPVHKLLQRDNRRAAIKRGLNTYNQHLQKWCWDSFPPALAWLSSDWSFPLLLGSACLPVEREESSFNHWTTPRNHTRSQHQWDAAINKSCTPPTRRPQPPPGLWASHLKYLLALLMEARRMECPGSRICWLIENRKSCDRTFV